MAYRNDWPPTVRRRRRKFTPSIHYGHFFLTVKSLKLLKGCVYCRASPSFSKKRLLTLFFPILLEGWLSEGVNDRHKPPWYQYRWRVVSFLLFLARKQGAIYNLKRKDLAHKNRVYDACSMDYGEISSKFLTNKVWTTIFFIILILFLVKKIPPRLIFGFVWLLSI